jgi:hypothetical protein
MYSFESLDELEETIPEFNDIPSATWWRLFLEVFLERPFVGKLKENIIAISMRVAAMKPYDIFRML